MERCTVVVAHEIPKRQPIQITPGERVEVGDRDSDWPEFVFVKTRSGSGWVPARHLSASQGPAIVLNAYDTTELRTVIGERLEVVGPDPVSGWTWCRNTAGEEGWVPDRTLGCG